MKKKNRKEGKRINTLGELGNARYFNNNILMLGVCTMDKTKRANKLVEYFYCRKEIITTVLLNDHT